MDESQALQTAAFVDEASRELKGLDARVWLERVESQREDVDAAFASLLEHGRSGDAMRMAVALYDFWRLSGRISEGRSRLDDLLTQGVSDRALMAEAHYRIGLLAFWQGDDEAAESSFRASLGMARQLRRPTAIAVALVGQARLELRSGNLEAARLLCAEALETVKGTDDQEGRSNALHVLAVTAQMRGDLLEARDRMTQRIQLAREMGNFGGLAGEASNLSHVERRLGNLARAEQLAAEALQIAHRRGDEWLVPYVLSALSACAVEAGQFTHAAQLLGAAAQMVEQQGAAWPPDEKPLFEQTRAAVAQALGPQKFDEAWSAGRARPVSEAVAFALEAARPAPQ